MKQAENSRRFGSDGAVTLHDIAELAGVHPMTVSNALKGTGRVAVGTREKIQRIAQELDYKPNLLARALVTGRTGSVAVATGPVSEHFYAHLLHLLEIELSKSEYKMLFLRSRDLGQDLLSTVKNSAVDGVIAIDAFPELRGFLQSGASIPPCVYAGVMGPDASMTLAFDHIKIDLSGAVRDAIQHLLDSGCKRIAYLASNEGMGRTTEVRARIYRLMMDEAGRESEIIDVDIGTDTSRRDLTRERFTAYIREHGCPDGIFCQNDEIAIAAYRGLRDLGLHVPNDVQLIGCDGLADMEYFDPPLATIQQPVEEMCALAWQFLQRRLSEPQLPVQEAVLTASFKIRPSLKV